MWNAREPTTVLERDQLREMTLDDDLLMREILAALVDDTKRQMALLDTAIREQDATRCMRLAHSSKGACANVGASGAAAILKEIESKAADRNFPECEAGAGETRPRSRSAQLRSSDIRRASDGRSPISDKHPLTP